MANRYFMDDHHCFKPLSRTAEASRLLQKQIPAALEMTDGDCGYPFGSGNPLNVFTVRKTKLELTSATPLALRSLSNRKREKCSRS